MNMLIAAALWSGAALAVSPLEHRVEIQHRGQPVTVRYTSDVAVAHKQVGAATPGGVASTLRCAWSANVTVHRHAEHAAGSASRTMAPVAAFGGTRPGWCDGQQKAIADEVANRGDEVRGRMLAAADADHDVLLAELERRHGTVTAG